MNISDKLLKLTYLSLSLLVDFTPVSAENSVYEKNVAEETVQNRAGRGLSISKEKYNLTEMMFSMERGGCAVAEASLENTKQNPNPSEEKAQSGGAASSKNYPPPDTSKMGLAPWQDGVLERLGQELTPQEYNMYVVHHGRMLVAFGQIEACTPREKDFVYGSLEPIPVQTLRSFKVMM